MTSATSTDTATTSASTDTMTSATSSDTATTSAAATSSAAATTSATDTTTAASTRAVELQRALDVFDNFPDAIVTTSTGETVDISTILPSKVQPMPESRSDLEIYNVDGVISEGHNMQSGKIEWNEMAVQGLHSCGRSNQEKRPRFIALQQEQFVKNLTKIETLTEIAT